MGPSSAEHLGSDSRLPLVRRLFQTAIVVLTSVVGYRMATGRSPDGIEVFCPFGGLETASSLLGGGRFTCATGAGNLAILGALLLLTVFARKAFCSWVCPIGTVAEGLARAGRLGKQAFAKRGWNRAWNRQLLGIWTPAPSIDRPLRWLRLPILAVILFFTYHAGELVFRSFDPYYILFSFHGHDVRGYSYAILGGVLTLALIIPMAWCRYLCPLGGALWPFSRLGLLRIGRSADACTGCRACDLACPHSIEVSRSATVRSGECTLCLECTAACPRGTALTLTTLHPTRPRVTSGWVVPALIVVLAIGGMAGASRIRVPSLVRDFEATGAASTIANRSETSGRRAAAESVAATGSTDTAASDSAASDAAASDAAAPDTAAPDTAAPDTAASDSAASDSGKPGVGTAANDAVPRSVRMTIDGVRCVDTSEAAIGQLEDIPGIRRATAYAARHEIEVLYDPGRVDVETIRRAFEAPTHDSSTGRYVFHRFRVLEIDGVETHDSNPSDTGTQRYQR